MRDEGLRLTYHAGTFYPRRAEEIRAFLEEVSRLPLPDPGPGPALGGVVPHAGWIYSGPTAAKVWRLLGERRPKDADLVVLFGAIHRFQAVGGPGVDFHSSWRTPIGDLQVDREALEALVEKGLVQAAPSVHQGEHSLEVQLPFLVRFLPGLKILPVAMPPHPQAPEAGRAMARVLEGMGRVPLAVGSTDLTHYGERFGFTPGGKGEAGRAWAKANDRRFLDLLLAMDAESLVPEARSRMNACGAGAAAAALAFSQEMGARRAFLVEHTDSQEVQPDPWSDIYVGYAGCLFLPGEVL